MESIVLIALWNCKLIRIIITKIINGIIYYYIIGNWERSEKEGEMEIFEGNLNYHIYFYYCLYYCYDDDDVNEIN